MGPTQINGLPAHILLVHVVVVLVPLAALATILSALWPAFRRKLGVITPLVALAALIAVPITTHAGEWLEARVFSTALIRHHVAIAHELLPWAGGLFIVSAGLYAYHRFAVRDGVAKMPIVAVLAVLALVAGVGSVVQVYRIGDSGSKAVWTGVFTQQPRHGN